MPLNFRGAIIDAERPDVAIAAFDDRIAGSHVVSVARMLVTIRACC
jgi:hypothetical protein